MHPSTDDYSLHRDKLLLLLRYPAHQAFMQRWRNPCSSLFLCLPHPNSHQEICELLEQQDILVACIQETKLISSSQLPTFDKHSVERRHLPAGAGGGLITLVHLSVNYTVVDSSPFFPDSTIEHLAIEVDVDDANLLVINVYIRQHNQSQASLKTSILSSIP